MGGHDDDEGGLSDDDTASNDTELNDTESNDDRLTPPMVERMTVAELKTSLEERGLSKIGNKPALKQRLLDAIASNVQVRASEDTRLYPNPGDGFCATAHWVELTPSTTPVPNPTREGFHNPRCVSI